MPIATMTTNGQITIPTSVRNARDLDTGDEVEVELTGDGAAILRPRHPAVNAPFGAITHRGPAVPIAAIDPGSHDAR